MNERVNLLGVEVNRMNLHDTLSRMSEAIDKGEKLRIAVTPVNCILWAYKNEKLKKIYNSADIVTADGVPLLWASKWLGKPIKGRVTGLDILPEFSKLAAEKGYRFFFLGAAPGVADKLGEVLIDEIPALKISGSYSPSYTESFSDEENQKMIKMINRSGTDVLWVGLTAPKQDLWIAEHFDKLNVNIAIGVGAAFDVVSGNIKRAPVFMQKAGFEWLYRLFKEPGRLTRRYLVEAPKFIPLIIKQKVQKKNK